MKVLMCNKFYRPVGGPETVMFDTMRELEALGHTAIPFSMTHPDNVESEYSDYFISGVDYNEKGSKNPKKLLKEAASLVYSKEAAEKITKLIRDTKPDIAHAHNIYHQLSPSILNALKKEGVPTVLTLHDGKLLCANMVFLRNGEVCDRCQGKKFHHAVINKCVKGSLVNSLLCCVEESLHRWTKAYERNVDVFISPSQFLKDKLVKFGRLKEDQITVIPNYADITSISPNYVPGSYGLFVGRMEPLKGVRTLLKACKQIPDFDMKLAGRGPEKDFGEQYIQSEGLSKVEFIGFQTGTDLTRLFREARFVVLPSECYENCPMVILEAFAAGKPVIASNLGGIPELINQGEDGFIFEPGDADGLASSMMKLISDPKLAEKMGRAGREKVERYYSIEQHMQSMLDLYNRVLNQSR